MILGLCFQSICAHLLDEQAKDYLLDVLKELSLNELIEVYKTSCDKEIEKLTDGIM